MLKKALWTLPKTLDDTYKRILVNIREEYSKSTKAILQWLAFSARPLRMEEIAEVLTIALELEPQVDVERRLFELRDLVRFCSSLVTILSLKIPGELEDIEVLRLAHLSVKDYLLSGRIRIGPSSTYSLQEANGNSFVAESCIAYLLQFHQLELLSRQTVQDFPLARYVAEYWTQHARIAEREHGTIPSKLLGIKQFVSQRSAFVNWI
jgi:hypothetical protein